MCWIWKDSINCPTNWFWSQWPWRICFSLVNCSKYPRKSSNRTFHDRGTFALNCRPGWGLKTVRELETMTKLWWRPASSLLCSTVESDKEWYYTASIRKRLPISGTPSTFRRFSSSCWKAPTSDGSRRVIE